MRGLTILFIFGSLCELFLAQKVTNPCLRCLCEATSGCKKDMKCVDGYCGPFYISEPYWIDAYRPCVGTDKPLTPGEYGRCAEDLVCTGKTIKRYMTKYARDCTGDGRINCIDYAKIHRLGPYACKGHINENFLEVMRVCLKRLNKDENGDDIVSGSGNDSDNDTSVSVIS
ncbi:lysozyme-like [Lycorma delicatula]|uniref:lysozyme-like n=1 Tax=Lycorma delicatula TaxID=130591 RepID=UPI003F5122EF